MMAMLCHKPAVEDVVGKCFSNLNIDTPPIISNDPPIRLGPPKVKKNLKCPPKIKRKKIVKSPHNLGGGRNHAFGPPFAGFFEGGPTHSKLRGGPSYLPKGGQGGQIIF